MGLKTAFLESAHSRPIFAARATGPVATEIKNLYQGQERYRVDTAECGCENVTRIINGRLSGDGVTNLCNKHGMPDDYEEE